MMAATKKAARNRAAFVFPEPGFTPAGLSPGHPGKAPTAGRVGVGPDSYREPSLLLPRPGSDIHRSSHRFPAKAAADRKKCCPCLPVPWLVLRACLPGILFGLPVPWPVLWTGILFGLPGDLSVDGPTGNQPLPVPARLRPRFSPGIHYSGCCHCAASVVHFYRDNCERARNRCWYLNSLTGGFFPCWLLSGHYLFRPTGLSLFFRTYARG
jgi:hypothetical protein